MSNLEIAAEELSSQGRISTLRTIYEAKCSCGMAKRNTRLAGTIHTLRHDYGWDIRTNVKPGMLAEYVLVKVGNPVTVSTIPPMPSNGETKPDGPRLWCPVCLSELTGGFVITRLLGGLARMRCDHCDNIVVAIDRPVKPTPQPPQTVRTRRKGR